MKKRQKPLQLIDFFEFSVEQYPNNIALICDNHCLTYQELDEKSNQLAHYLFKNNLRKGDVVGVLIERSVDNYIAILALLKIGAAYIPIDIEHPDERINHIIEDYPLKTLLSTSSQIKRAHLQLPSTIIIDKVAKDIAKQPLSKPTYLFNDEDSNNLCYVIYTSGTTGRPKGVEITHQNICHYVFEASKIYKMRPEDRVYQGFSLAFDASLEEIWMAFANGATLVACTCKDTRSGVDLIDFLNEQKITVFSTVPSLLAHLDTTANFLRVLILGGEALHPSLLKKWFRPNLRIINTYGPTETTVIASYMECLPDKPITIGKPLPGYSIFILDEHLNPVPCGQTGEMFISGTALSRGYVNQPDNTALKFIDNPFDRNSKLYRTGDKAFAMPNGEFQFVGRIDDQIKLRGFRIELNEIESTILRHQDIAQTVVSLQQVDDQPTLVAYLLASPSRSLDITGLKNHLRQQLPEYMIPSLFEIVTEFPRSTSGKIDKKALPKPTKHNNAQSYIAPTTPLEKEIAQVWGNVFHQDKLSTHSDFFYDLGGHSLTAATVISHLRKRPGFKDISILDLYNHPSVHAFARYIETKSTQAGTLPNKKEKYHASAFSYYGCGALQFLGCLFQYAISAWQMMLVFLAYLWVAQNAPLFSLKSVVVFFALAMIMPVVSLFITISTKWLIVGRIKPGKYKLWGWFYVRWWLVQRLQHKLFSPKKMIGTPIVNVYYRLLGAQIGKGCYIATDQFMIPDMITLGEHCSIGLDVHASGYIVEDGWLKIGKIDVGNHAYVGARSVLSINTVIQDHGVLDELSMLPSGKQIPANHFYTGSPAKSAERPRHHITVNQPTINKIPLFQSVAFSFLHGIALSFNNVMYFASFIPSAMLLFYFFNQTHYMVATLIGIPLASTLFFVVLFINIYLRKKILMNKIRPGTYPINSLYYLRQWAIQIMLDIDEIGVLADSLFFPLLLKALGANIGKYVEFGEAPHITPELLTAEEGSFAASSVSVAWPVMYNGYISYGKATLKEGAFIGNVSLLPAGYTIGKQSLLGCMTKPPIDHNHQQSNATWLGSPAIFLPNREIITGISDDLTHYPSKQSYWIRLLIESFRVSLPTMCSLFLVCNLFAAMNYLLNHYSLLNSFILLPLINMGLTLGVVAALILLKWGLIGHIKPCIKPLWDIFIRKNDIREFSYGYFINKFLTGYLLGTPFIALLYRAMGAKIGRRTFIDSDGFAEFDLISIGHDTCINAHAIIQTHLYEDRIFKLEKVTIHNGCNIGVASMVLYNTVMEDGSTLGSLSLLMKGERLPANTSWEGSPAQATVLLEKETLPLTKDSIDAMPEVYA